MGSWKPNDLEVVGLARKGIRPWVQLLPPAWWLLPLRFVFWEPACTEAGLSIRDLEDCGLPLVTVPLFIMVKYA